MKKKYLEIRALDPLFFRDGKPFSMGEETWAEGMFLPNPSVILGALFTALVSHKLCSFDDVDKLYIKQLLYFSKDTFLLSAPLDMFIEGSDTLKPVSIQKRTKREDIITSLKQDFAGVIFIDSKEDLQSSTQHFITNANYITYLKYVNDSTTELIEQTKYGGFLPKIGIGRSNETHTAEKSSLFRIDMIEYKSEEDFGFIVEVESDLDFPNNFLIKLGAEGRIAFVKNKTIPETKRGAINWVRKFNEQTKEQEKIIQDLINSEYFRVVFKSPLLLENDLLSYFPHEKVNLLSVITSKPIRIGGFDYKTKSPKPMRKAYSIGTVLYFSKPIGTDLTNFTNYLKSITLEDARFGFNAFDFAKLNF